MIKMKHETAVAKTATIASQVMTPGGKPMGGKPPVIAPIVETPWALASVAVEMMIDKMTAMRAPGTFGMNCLKPTMMTTVPMAKANVGHDRFGISLIQSICCWNQLPVPLGTPSMPGI